MEFLPSLSVLGVFTITALILMLTPGPDMALFLGRAVTHGRAAGFAALLGVSSGLLVHTFLAAFGISALIHASPAGFVMLKIVGAAYLLWLAIQAIRNGSSFAIESAAAAGSDVFGNWLAGLGINLLNPKIVIFFLTFLPQFVSAADPNAATKIAFLGFYFIALSLLCCTVLICLVDHLSHALKRSPQAVRVMDWIFAGVFSAFAVRILLVQR